MTIDEKIHIFENSRLVSEYFTEEAVTAAYVEALSALRAQQEAEKNEPLTEEKLSGMNGLPVYDATFKMWCLIKKMEPSYLGGIEPVYNDGSIRPDPLYGREYYRRPPEEAEE